MGFVDAHVGYNVHAHVDLAGLGDKGLFLRATLAAELPALNLDPEQSRDAVTARKRLQRNCDHLAE